ncbi:MAG: bifunctional methylenetetrahydrofolate dehydrogenase/methenyltetrahydrofolate cyclohydrolase [Actinomycetales bacterium]|nr:bifunctional methylenetetrahydrofolate dehydrogenase/methenyltetrahydrofolate cyclohydrolase [Actinomycetales bacterium]
MTRARILDGNLAAAAMKEELKVRISRLSRKPGLATVLVGRDPGSVSYVAGKHRDCADVGIESIRVELDDKISSAHLIAEIEKLNADSHCTGMIVQLPLPTQMDVLDVLSRINPEKDADGLHPINLGRLALNQPGIIPCTPLGIVELAKRNHISLEGKDVVILGRGTTVGRPLELLLSNRGYNSTVTLAHTGTKDLLVHTKRADIIIVAIGKPHFLKAEMIKPGAIVFDVGITRSAEGIVGDVDPGVAQVASALAPMPGGVGPMTRAMLLSNIVSLAERR